MPPPTLHGAGERAKFIAYDNVEQWVWAGAVSIAAALRRGLERTPRPRLLLSGGSTPGAAYAALARAPLDWTRIDVGLVDERWLQPDDPDSNAYLVRRQLLQGDAASAHFETMTRAGRSLDEAVATANLHAQQTAEVVVLGMGEDGHTASLFPGMPGLAQALHSTQAYVAVDARGCPGAGAWPRRISLTPAGLAGAKFRLLLIRGEAKRALFERALAGDDAQALPVRIAFAATDAPLHVQWCP